MAINLSIQQFFRMSTKAIRRWFFRGLFNPRIVWFYDRWFPTKQTGQRGELLACRYLLKKGYVIIESGYQDKMGEIDLIAVDEKTLVFIEVKTRLGSDENPAEAVDLQKQKRVTETAKRYTKRHQLTEQSIRFDVIAVQWESSQPDVSSEPLIQHYQAAFPATINFQLY